MKLWFSSFHQDTVKHTGYLLTLPTTKCCLRLFPVPDILNGKPSDINNGSLY